MAQPVFPTLDREPTLGGYERGYAFDNRIVSEFENGFQLARERDSDVPQTWIVTYRFLSDANMSSLRTFWEGNWKWGAEVVKWTDPKTDSDFFVRWQKDAPPLTETLEVDNHDTWKVTLFLVEVLGSYV